MGKIAEQLAQLRKEIQDIALQCGRNPEEITLVAVSKFRPVSDIQEAIASNQLSFGENRPQELRDKYQEIQNVEWHMIGRLQRNKVKYIAPFVHLIHSLDSLELLSEIEKEGRKNGRVIPCLVQMNISDESQKGGGDREEAKEILWAAKNCPHIAIIGLMGMAEFTEDESVIRNQFKRLKTAFDAFSAEELPSNVQMKEISMGMSGDYAIAIQEGATILRIGSAIFA